MSEPPPPPSPDEDRPPSDVSGDTPETGSAPAPSLENPPPNQPRPPSYDKPRSYEQSSADDKSPSAKSPWARPEQPPAEYLPPEPRFAGQPYGQPPAEYAPPGAYSPYGAPGAYSPYGAPGAYPPADAPAFGGHPAGDFGQPWSAPDADLPGSPPTQPPGQRQWQAPWQPTPPSDDRQRKGVRLLIGLLVVALIAGLTVTLVATSSTSTPNADPGVPAPSSAAPGGGSTPAPSTGPTPSPSPLPSSGLLATPPALLAIGYHAYSLGLRSPADVALGPAEEVQFKRYGLSRIVGLEALTIGRSIDPSDDYAASINILQFGSPAGAKAELDYSNTENKKQSSTTGLPGLPAATAFVTAATATAGVSIGAFTTVGRYQVVVIVNGLTPNHPTSATVVAAEAARVMKAVLPDAGAIVPDSGSGGSGPQVPALPTPAPTGTHA